MPPSTQALNFSPSTASPNSVVPISGTSEWVTAVAAGGLTVSERVTGDVAVKNSFLISHSSRRILTRAIGEGTTLIVRLRYDNSDTVNPSVPPLVIRVFGATNSQPFIALVNVNGDASVPIPISPATDSFYDDFSTTPVMAATIPNNSAHAWDCQGCNKFLIAVEYAYSPAAGGNPSAAYLEAKIV